MSETNKQIALKFLNALCGGDVETLKSVASEETVAIQPGTALTAGTRTYAEIIATCEAFPLMSKNGLQVNVLNVTAEDDRVAIEWEGGCTLVNGQEYNNRYHMLFFVRDGKVVRLMEYLDAKLADEVLLPLVASMNS